MAQYSTGGFVVLPGGYGTFEELMEMVTWNQVSLTAARTGDADQVSSGYTSCRSSLSMVRVTLSAQGYQTD